MIRGSSFSSFCIWLEHALFVFMRITSCSSSRQLLYDSAFGSDVNSPVRSGGCLTTYGAPAVETHWLRQSGWCSLPWYDLNKKRNMAEDEAKCDLVPSNSNENAIVLYSPPILEQFHRSARTFHLAGRDFSVKQNWAEFGVAAVVWDAAIVLCEYLEKETKSRHLSLEGKQVIELGAGTGLVGMVASHLKGHLTITDRAPVFKPLRDNVLLNFSPPPPSSSGPSSSSTPSAASSSSNSNSPSPVDSTQKPTSQPTMPVVRVLEWGQDLDKFSEPFDIILGADIVYIEDTFQDLLQTLLHLSNQYTLILLSCRIRYQRDDNFLDMMKEKFKVEHVLHDDERGIEIYSAKKL